jgi:hypothetical protein
MAVDGAGCDAGETVAIERAEGHGVPKSSKKFLLLSLRRSAF